jgi:hypothetical protein
VAKGWPAALFAAAAANGWLPASQSATARNATGLANVVVMFVVVLAKLKQSNHDVQTITPVSHDRWSPFDWNLVSIATKIDPHTAGIRLTQAD